jgi:hypothetical protein
MLLAVLVRMRAIPVLWGILGLACQILPGETWSSKHKVALVWRAYVVSSFAGFFKPGSFQRATTQDRSIDRDLQVSVRKCRSRSGPPLNFEETS